MTLREPSFLAIIFGDEVASELAKVILKRRWPWQRFSNADAAVQHLLCEGAPDVLILQTARHHTSAAALLRFLQGPWRRASTVVINVCVSTDAETHLRAAGLTTLLSESATAAQIEEAADQCAVSAAGRTPVVKPGDAVGPRFAPDLGIDSAPLAKEALA